MTLVTAIIRDQAGNTYANALVEASYLSNIPSGTGSGPPLVSGSVFQTFSVTETDTFGNLSMNLTDLAVITPTGGSWFFNVLNSGRTIGFSLNSFAVTGVSVDLTAAFAAASAPLFPAINLNTVGVISFVEQAAPAGSVGKDVLWGDSTAHRLKVKNNNGAATTLAQFTDNLSVFAATTSAQLAGVISDETGSGPLVFATGSVIAPASRNGLAVVYADQFANVQAAINALPAGGGCVDARSPNCNLALGTLDPGSDTKPVTLLLGPLAYTADHIVMRSNFRIIGNSAGGSAGTSITSVGANTQPLFVNITSGAIFVAGASIENLALFGAAGNTSQKCIFFDVSANSNASVIDHMFMSQVNIASFKGSTLHFKGTLNSGTLGNFIQFTKFDHVLVFRPTGGAEALRCEGGVGQSDYYSCQFDGPVKGDGNNIYLGGTSNSDTTFPYSHNFFGLTSQAANTSATFDGCYDINFYGSHYENLNGVYLLQSSFTNARNGNLTFSGGYFANSGINAGNGFILKTTTTQVNTILENSCLFSAPDKLVVGTNLNTITVRDNIAPGQLNSAVVTTGIDAAMNPAATLDLGGYHTVALQASGTSITTIHSQLGPGETITFFANGTCQFATGGNLAFGPNGSPLVLNSGDQAVFCNSDFSGTNVWRLLSVTSTLAAASGKKLTFNNSLTLAGTDATTHTFPNNTGTVAETNFAQTFSADQTFSTKLITGRIKGSGSAPTASSTGIGASGTVTVFTGDTDSFMILALVVAGAGPAATGTLTVTLTSAIGANFNIGVAMLSNADTGQWDARATIKQKTNSTTAPTFTWDNNGVALVAGNNYQLCLHIVGA